MLQLVVLVVQRFCLAQSEKKIQESSAACSPRPSGLRYPNQCQEPTNDPRQLPTVPLFGSAALVSVNRAEIPTNVLAAVFNALVDRPKFVPAFNDTSIESAELCTAATFVTDSQQPRLLRCGQLNLIG
ncbi:hypothetical protein PGT21_025027 [Puccinia graminis f. sp. tritici]|uniref:Secreted protein n=1 Tax=Puccinia graminis f. sp. tritici TaxID=56615 RepID=A0A5B0LYC6_PUCGR|nr:hypothetical protein PGT21_025027 [Puccinia graminis f. sp. tritici]